jgi:hypothetical protein
MPTKSLKTEESIKECLPYVDEKHQKLFLQLMQNIEVITLEPTLIQQPSTIEDPTKQSLDYAFKVFVFRIDIGRSNFVYEQVIINESDDEHPTDPKLYFILDNMRNSYKTHPILKSMFTENEINALPMVISVQSKKP